MPHSRALYSCSPGSGLQDRTESWRATRRTTLRGQARSMLLMSSQGLLQMGKEVEETTCRPSVQRVAKQAGSDHPHASPQRLAFTPEPWQAGQAVGKQGTESPLLKPKLRGWEYFPGGREGRPRLAPLAPPCTTLGEAGPPRLSQGRGKGLSQEIRGRHWVTGPALGALWACESAPRSAPWGLLCSQSRGQRWGWMAGGAGGGEGPPIIWDTQPPSAPEPVLPLRPPHPRG